MEPRRTVPHDALVRAAFSQTAHAAGFLLAVLPRAIAARVDFSTLTLRPGSFVDRALRRRHTDLLFSAKLAGREALVYVLFEHQSTVDPLMALRLLLYLTRIWEQVHRAHPKARRLPPIVPVVLHHSPRGWSASTTFEGLLDVDEPTLEALGEHTVRLRFVLDDISTITDGTLRSRVMTALGRLVLFCLRHSREPDELMRRLRQWRDVVAEARRAPNGREALELVWRYILLANPRRQPEEVIAHLLEAAGEEAKEEVMTAGEVLIERGWKQGQKAMLLKLLQARFGDLPEAAAARIEAATPKQNRALGPPRAHRRHARRSARQALISRSSHDCPGRLRRNFPNPGDRPHRPSRGPRAPALCTRPCRRRAR
ncbi:MAG: Rpn family recombination-promoting nuclease/putative transposase [Minicystis sp.]